MSFLKRTNKKFVSDEDRFLREFDAKNPEKSEAQQQEIDKAAKVSQSRDFEKPPTQASKIWKDF